MLINALNTLWANQSRQVVPSECLMQAPSYLMCFIYFPHSQQVNQNTKWEGLQEGGFPPPICVTSTNIKLNVNHSIFFPITHFCSVFPIKLEFLFLFISISFNNLLSQPCQRVSVVQPHSRLQLEDYLQM